MVCAPPLARPGRPGFQGLHGLVDALQCCVRLCTTMMYICSVLLSVCVSSVFHCVQPPPCVPCVVCIHEPHTCSATWHGFNTHSAFGVAGGAEAVYIVVMSCMLYVLCAMSMHVIDYSRYIRYKCCSFIMCRRVVVVSGRDSWTTRGCRDTVVSSVTADCARQPARGAWREHITHTTLVRHQQQQHAARS